VAERNPALNAVVTLDEERATARAEEADEALARGQSWGPLHGLPLTVKDTFETAGLRTTSGFVPLSNHVPATNATAVQRLLDAGAVVFGKTNVPQLAGDWQSFNAIFGTTGNPWNVTRTPGGSSGGSAAAVAAGLSSFELGSDIAGSIRVPAHWCGIYGHKPTYGLIPMRGHIPGPPGTVGEVDLAVAGPLARSARDLDLLLRVLAGPSPERAKGWVLELPRARRRGLHEYRVAAWLDDEAFSIDPSYRALLQSTIEELRSTGITVDEKARPPFSLAQMNDLYGRLVWPIMSAGSSPDEFEAMLRQASEQPPDSLDPFTIASRCGTARHRDWIVANEIRHQLRAGTDEFFERFDVLLTPVNQVAAIPHDQSELMFSRTVTIGAERRPYSDLMAWIATATALLLPSTVAPIGRTSDGLPVGVQIIGPYLEDATTIHFATLLEEAVYAFAAPPLA
jgi:amidase